MSSEDPTKRFRAVAAIVLVSSEADQIESCRSCAEALDVYFEHCTLDGAATAASTWRPFALVVDEAVFSDASAQIEELANEARATLLVLDRDARSSSLTESLMPRLKNTYQQYFA